jgi:Sec-independent protein translocase protein TatA
MEHIKGIIEAIAGAAKDFGVGFWSFGTLMIVLLLVYKSPEIIKAISTFVTEHRKTTAQIKGQQRRLALEIDRKKVKIQPIVKKETRK